MRRISVTLLLAVFTVTTAWAQTPTPSTELEQYLTMSNRMVYRFNYPSTSVTGEPVVLSSLLACWAPSAPEEGDGIESVHMYSHYTVSANSQCPTSSTLESADFVALSLLFEGGAYDASQPYKSIVKRSIVIMPDYEGYGVTADRTHPYLVEDVTAQQVVDAFTYGLQLYAKLDGADNTLPLKDDWRSFSIGYSQGGAAALAVQRYIEANNLSDELHFRGTLCGDGPYDLIATMRYYMDDDGTSYDVATAHRQDQVTLPAVLPMIMNGMIVSNPTMSVHQLSDYFSQSFLDTGIMDWLSGKDMTTDDINNAWLAQIDNGSVTIGDKTYPAPANMNEMFFEQEVPGMIWGTTTVAWAMLNKIFTPGFYNYMKDPAHFLSTPAMTGDAYEDMHSALVANNVCTGWQPLHRIQFAHSKGDMIVPYGNYLAFCEAHPDGEDDWYRVDNTFSDKDHLNAGTAFVMSLGTKFFDYFQWIDAAAPTDVKTVYGLPLTVYGSVYDLQGRKLQGKPTQKGIYIMNGRKTIVK
ncbi:MAG: hypothetical protein IJP46_08205 [Prevotella sp.]|nr:hypothetical protein [Prevotella sp.]